jgi:hypothetical protein
MRWVVHVARVKEITDSYSILVIRTCSKTILLRDGAYVGALSSKFYKRACEV